MTAPTLTPAPVVKPRRGARLVRRTQASPTAYVFLAIVLVGSAFPLWWSYVIGSKDSAAIVQDPYSFIPGGHFLQNASTVITTIPFWKALGNSILVSSTVAVLVVLFSAMAGFASPSCASAAAAACSSSSSRRWPCRRSSGSCRSSSS
jgi:cellobiose transport system permease protein